MTWLAWRQFRAQGIVALASVIAVTGVFVITGFQVRHLATASGYPACLTASGECRRFSNAVHASSVYPLLFFASMGLLYLAPVFIGIFWGAPLVAKELSSGSYQLLWTQSITRTRWLTTKLLLVGTVTVITSGVISGVITWWSAPMDAAEVSQGLNRFSPVIFGARGIVPVGYAFFAFALGVACGVLTRRTLPAMAITVGLLLAVQIVTPLVARPHYQPAVTRVIAVAGSGRGINLRISGPGPQLSVIVGNAPRGSWVLSDDTIDSTGRIFSGTAPAVCLSPNFQRCWNYLLSLHLRERLRYQPDSRFWTFQAYETALLVALSLALLGASAWRVKRIG
jgi:hypothetical protein